MLNESTRREFLQVTSAGLAAGLLTASTATVAKAANDKLVASLIGCGGR